MEVYSQNAESQNGEKNRFAILTFVLYFKKDQFATFGAQKRTCAYEGMEGTFSLSYPKNFFQKWILQLLFGVPDYILNTCC